MYYCASYWYSNTCLFPDMGTVFIAIDKTDIHNGCLKVSRSIIVKAWLMGFLQNFS